MRCIYDLHIHSCLSPCGAEEMTPRNIVAMASLLNLDIIAITDHNTTGNCRAVMDAGQGSGVLVLPGMELCTSEEIHVVCLFATLNRAEAFEMYVRPTLMPVKNRPEIFGRQLLLDENDRLVGEEDLLLTTASGISIENVAALCGEYGGVCYPAHIDRPAFGLLSNLGGIPPQPSFTCAEISADADEFELLRAYPALGAMRLIYSSDAHNLEAMARPRQEGIIELSRKTAKDMLSQIKAPSPTSDVPDGL